LATDSARKAEEKSTNTAAEVTPTLNKPSPRGTETSAYAPEPATRSSTK
jgi:hypothetical protein